MKNTSHIKAANRREKQYQSLIDAAEQMIAVSGLGSLKARALASRVGIALGQIYNLASDLDEIILNVNSRTIARLEVQITLPATHQPDAVSAVDRLISIAIRYHHFARENYHLWHALFDHHPSENKKKLPVWVTAQRLHPFLLIEQLLVTLCPHMTVAQQRIFAQTLFSAVHGMILLALDARDVGVPKVQLDEQIHLHLTLLCRGLKTYE